MHKIIIDSQRLFKALNKIRGVNKFFVFNLLRLDEVLDIDTFNAVISSVSNSNGTAKTTYKNRFLDLDHELLKIVKKGWNIHDTAVSDGVTSYELYEKLVQAGLEINFTFSDFFSKIYYSKHEGLDVFFDVERAPIFAYDGSQFISKQVGSFFTKSIQNFIKIENKKMPDNAKTIWLFNSNILRLKNEGKVRALEYNLFKDATPNEFHFIRCMNVLNTIYFSEQQILNALNNLAQSLKKGGFLLVGRTELNGTNKATFYQKIDKKFQPFKDINGGSEIDCLVKGIEQHV